ncbi:hypothetical protein LO772_26020 [Yinghuangia sp. ASG 101]|uniref:hypothetical protein n=1 Tax=Yinghuangia sp. ASG 101 TaxID=2896848 RepID=UPI001E31243C|nr:hypothetical protein [Yinghuangia sp. ASG 101]UGQ10299.1 hypothetical protein LO772_26020 [Yinghuangia sp. ASG 101]
MDDVRLTPAERRALSRIEGELRKDRDLDRAMRRMRPPGARRRSLLGRAAPEPPEATDRDGRITDAADIVEDTEPPVVRNAPADETPARAPEPAARSDASEEEPRERARHADDDPLGDRRRVWILTAVVSVLLAAVLTVGTPFFLLFTMVLVTLAATAGVVWLCVAFSMRRPGTG